MIGVQDGGWSLQYSRRAEKDVARLDPPVRRRVLNALGQVARPQIEPAICERSHCLPSPFGGPPTGKLHELPRLRVPRFSLGVERPDVALPAIATGVVDLDSPAPTSAPYRH